MKANRELALKELETRDDPELRRLLENHKEEDGYQIFFEFGALSSFFDQIFGRTKIAFGITVKAVIVYANDAHGPSFSVTRPMDDLPLIRDRLALQGVLHKWIAQYEQDAATHLEEIKAKIGTSFQELYEKGLAIRAREAAKAQRFFECYGGRIGHEQLNITKEQAEAIYQDIVKKYPGIVSQVIGDEP